MKTWECGWPSQWAGGLRGLRHETQCALSVSLFEMDDFPLMGSPWLESKGPLSLSLPAPCLCISLYTKEVGPAAGQAFLVHRSHTSPVAPCPHQAKFPESFLSSTTNILTATLCSPRSYGGPGRGSAHGRDRGGGPICPSGKCASLPLR